MDKIIDINPDKNYEYAIYKIKLIEAKEISIENCNVNSKETIKEAQHHFENIFLKEVEIKGFGSYKDDGKDFTHYPNYVKKVSDHIIVWQINNKQSRSYTERDDESRVEPVHLQRSVDSFPPCYVIIDNRPGICQMAIECGSAFSKPDKVRDLIQTSFHYMLGREYKLDIQIDPKMEPTEFWEFIHREVYVRKNRISNISFNFPNRKKVEGLDLPEIHRSGIKAMAKVVETTKALEGRFQMKVAKDSDLSKRNKDIAEMVSLCSCNAYGISVKFAKGGVYRCNDKIRATLPIKGNIITDFISLNQAKVMVEGKPQGEFELKLWLDEVRKRTKGEEDAAKTPKRAS